jgi:hypothetical protein
MRLARLLVAAICVVALSRLLEAQGASSQLESVDLKGSVGGVLDELAHMRGTGVRTKVIGLDTTDSSFIFPSAGAVQGAGGTYFRSDVMIVNHRSSTQRVSVGWIAQGVNNSNRPLQYFDLTANTPYILSDFVTNTIHQSGLGAILVTGVTSGGNADTNATLDGFSRIYTNQPGAQGTVSLSFPSIGVLDSFGNSFAYALGMRHDPSYRCNVGIVNLDTASAHTWNVNLNGLSGSTSFQVTVDPVSMKQVSVPAGNYGDLLVSLAPTVNGFWWSAYAASVDNITGDGWVSHASQP